MMYEEYGDVIKDASLISYNTYGIKTSCDYLIKVDSAMHLLLLIKNLKKNNVKYYILGKGSNVILPDTKFNGVIISLEYLDQFQVIDNTIISESGIYLSKLCKLAISHELSGLEYFANIPGTLGGAIYGNAGVKEHEIYDNLLWVKVIRNDEIIKINKEEIKHSYRHTEFKTNNDIILECAFELKNGDKDSMYEYIKEERIKRLNTQPLEYRNAGSVFKNPKNNSAGKLIDEAGLKGYRIGDAEVSEKHANFIINLGNATSKDIKDLIDHIKKVIYDKYKIKLKLEQIIVSWD